MDFTNLLNQKRIILYLEQLGLSDTETSLYITLLETGPIKIRDLAKKMAIKRTTTYSYIDTLIKKELVTNSNGLICANEPTISIQKLVDNKIELANKIQTDFPDMLKMMHESISHKNIPGVSDIRYYSGKKSVENIYLDLLNAREIRGITNISEFLDIFPETFQVVDKAIQEDKIKKFFEIVDDSLKTKLALQESVEHTDNRYQCKYFPEGMNISSTIITIYDGKVSLVNTRDTISGVILQSPLLYDNFKLFFDLIWNNISMQQ